MSQTSSNSSPADALDVVTRREAAFRLKTTQDFLVYTTQLKAQQEKIHELYDELGERNTYIHELHQKQKEHAAHVHTLHEERARHAEYVHTLHEEAARRDEYIHSLHEQVKQRDEYVHTLHVAAEEASRRQLAQAVDLETFARRLRQAEDETAALRTRVAEMKSSWGWGASSWLRALQRKLGGGMRAKATAAELPGYDFVYHLHTSPYRIFRDTRATFRGWILPRDGRAVTAVRVRLGDDRREFGAQHGIEDAEARAEQGVQANNPRPGFAVDVTLTPGRQRFRLEAQLDGREWLSVLTTPLWCEPKGNNL